MAKNNAQLAGRMAQQELTNLTPAQHALVTVRERLMQRSESFSVLLPKSWGENGGERFALTAYNYVRANPSLLECSPASLLDAFTQAAQQGLDFGLPNEAHVVPFKGTARLMRGYKGLLKLARRSGNVAFIDANPVYANDLFEIAQGDTPRVIHKPAFPASPGECVGFYSVAKTATGDVYVLPMGNDEVWRHAKRFTKAAKSGPFADIATKGPKAENWIPYGLKTVLIAICSRKLDLSTELASAIVAEFSGDEQPVILEVEGDDGPQDFRGAEPGSAEATFSTEAPDESDRQDVV